MNNKGFTLIELLATIVIIGLVTTFAFVSVTGSFEKSKDRAEDAFYSEIETYMDDYITISGSKGKEYNYYCKYEECYEANSTYRKYYCSSYDSDGNCKEEKYDNVTLKYSDSFNINSVVNEIVNDDLVNPKTNVKCTDDNMNITVYRDSDYVYCYVIKPNGEGSCIDRVINTCGERYYENIDGGSYIEIE